MRFLLLSRHFPPAVSGGARRPFMWAKGLMAQGHEVFVIAPDIPEGIQGAVVEHPNRDPGTGLPGPKTLRDYARDLLLWPDPDIRWTRRAIAVAKSKSPFAPDWIITTSPPESIHAAGKALLAHWPRSKWAVDARDHWLIRAFRSQRRNPLRASLERWQAKRMLAPAKAVFAVNDLIRDEFADYAPDAHMETLPHFVDPAIEPYPFEQDGIHLVHTGSFKLSDPDVSIEPLISAFEAALALNPSLWLHLAGRLRDDEIDAVNTSSANDRIDVMGLVPLETALSLQAGADALIVVAAPEAPVPPGKIAEYRATGRPIIPVGNGPWRAKMEDHPGTDAQRLAATQSGSQGNRPGDVLDSERTMAKVVKALEAL